MFYLILGVFLIFGACSDEEEEVIQTPLVEDASLRLSVDKVTLSCAGGTAEVKLETNQEIWDAVPSAGRIVRGFISWLLWYILVVSEGSTLHCLRAGVRHRLRKGWGLPS